MVFRINTNIASMNAYRNLNITGLGIDKSLNSLSSGIRIQSASDNASGIAIADTLRQQAEGLSRGIANANEGVGLVQVADAALEQYTKIIDAVKSKAIQAASSGQSSNTRNALQKDIEKLLKDANSISLTTSFNGISLLDGAYKNKSFHIGAYSGESVKISIDSTLTSQISKFAMTSSTSEATNSSVVGFGNTSAASSAGTASLSVTVSQSDGTKKAITSDTVNISAGEHTADEIAQAVADSFNSKAQDEGIDVRASVYETSSSTFEAPLYAIRISAKDDLSEMKLEETVQDGKASSIEATASATLNNNFSKIDVSTTDGAERAIITAGYALKELAEIRSNIGSVQNQLISAMKNIYTTQINVQAAESQIRDVDFAFESQNFAKLRIMSKSGSFAMSQANGSLFHIMRLLESSA